MYEENTKIIIKLNSKIGIIKRYICIKKLFTYYMRSLSLKNLFKDH